MSGFNKKTIRRKPLVVAVASAIQLFSMTGVAHATGLSLTTDSSQNLTISGSNTSQTAIVVAPSNYNDVVVNGSDGLSTTVVGYATGNGNYNLTTPTNVAAVPTVTIASGSQVTTGKMDLSSGLASPATLYDLEGISVWQAGTDSTTPVQVINNGVVTNANVLNGVTINADGSAALANGGNIFLTTNGQKVYFAGDDGTTPQRVVGVYLQNSNQALTNNGSIILGVTDASLANSSLFTNVNGASFTKPTMYAVFMNGNDGLVDQVTLNNNGTIAGFNLTSGGHITVGGTSVTSAASVSVVEAKENVLNGFINNNAGATIAGYSDLLTAAGSASATTNSTTGVATGTYTAPAGTSVNAINTDNNSINLTINNAGTLASYSVAYTQGTNTVSAPSTTVYGTVIADSLANMTVNNSTTGQILGDITVGNSSNTFTLNNAGTIKGNIVVTQDASTGNVTQSTATVAVTAASGTGVPTPGGTSAVTLVPVAVGTLTAAQTSTMVNLTANSTSTNSSSGTSYISQNYTVTPGQIITSGIYAFQVVNGGTIYAGDKLPGISGALAVVTDANGNQWETTTPTTQNNQININPVVTGSANGSGQLQAGYITGGLYVNNTASGSGQHPFEILITPVVANGVVVQNGNTLKWAGQNITFGSSVTDLSCTAGTCTSQSITAANAISNGNVQIANTNPLVTWSFANGATYVLNATTVDARSIAGVSGNAGNAINALLSFNSVLGNTVQQLTSAGSIAEAGNQLRPEVNGAGFQAAMSVTNKVIDVIENHLAGAQLAASGSKSGVSTGDPANGTGVWMQGFGFHGDQDRRQNEDGYTADAYGFAMGVDRAINDRNDLRLGGAVSYGRTSVDAQGDNQGNTDHINSYQVSLYGSKLMDGWYLNGTLGLGKHDYETKRLVVGNLVDGSHDAWQYTARVDAGRPMLVGKVTLTPVASLTYSRLNQNGYTETGVGALQVNGIDTDSFRSGLGGKAMIPLHDGDVNTALELRAIWNHEFADTRQDTTAQFVAGGGAFTTTGVSPARDGLDLGGSLVLAHTDKDVRTNLLLSYDAEVKDQYFSQTARLQARFDF